MPDGGLSHDERTELEVVQLFHKRDEVLSERLVAHVGWDFYDDKMVSSQVVESFALAFSAVQNSVKMVLMHCES